MILFDIIFKHGSFNPAHALAILTVLAVFADLVLDKAILAIFVVFVVFLTLQMRWLSGQKK